MTWARVTRPSRGTSPDAGEDAVEGGGNSLFVNLALFELALREVLKLADGAGDFRRVRGGEADDVLAIGVLLLQADVADVRDVDFDVGLTFDDHGHEPPCAPMLVEAAAGHCAADLRRTAYASGSMSGASNATPSAGSQGFAR